MLRVSQAENRIVEMYLCYLLRFLCKYSAVKVRGCEDIFKVSFFFEMTQSDKLAFMTDNLKNNKGLVVC